jgi:hypothetical protein
MNEAPKRLAPTYLTLRELYLRSGNVCAFPGCDALMMDEDGNFIGQICHIEAAEPGGERFNPAMTNEERRSASNLLLLCYPHHVATNDIRRYAAADLRKIKVEHEARYSTPTSALYDRLGKLQWGTLIAGGVIAGIVLDELARSVRASLDSLLQSDEEPEPIPLRTLLLRQLRFVPAGVVYFYAADPMHRAVGEQFLDILGSAGWQVVRLDELPAEQGTPELNSAMMMAFEVGDKERLDNVRQAIHEFFRMCGFSVTKGSEEVGRSGGKLIKIYTPFVVRRKFTVPFVRKKGQP